MNALVQYEDGKFDVMQRAAKALAESGYFADAKSLAQAVVKVMAGAELGLAPFASMAGIHIIQGRPALGANVIATLIKNDPRYDYRVVELTDAVCRIQFYENGQACGVSEFTATDAKKAGTKNMDRYAKNMLFARAMSNGAKWFVPGVFGGAPIYTPEELGADVDGDGDIVEGVLVETAQPAKATRPAVAEVEPEPEMPGANLRSINFAGADLHGANLRGAHLRGANMEGVNLAGANLEGANLEGANLTDACLVHAKLHRTHLRGANLEGANLTGANLIRASLEGANLTCANLAGARLSHTISDSYRHDAEAAALLRDYDETVAGFLAGTGRV